MNRPGCCLLFVATALAMLATSACSDDTGEGEGEGGSFTIEARDGLSGGIVGTFEYTAVATAESLAGTVDGMFNFGCP